MQVRNFSPTNNYSKQNYAQRQSFTSKFQPSWDLSELKARSSQDNREKLNSCINTIENDYEDGSFTYEVKYRADGTRAGEIYKREEGEYERSLWATADAGLPTFEAAAEKSNKEKKKWCYETAAGILFPLLLSGVTVQQIIGYENQLFHDKQVENYTELRKDLNKVHSSKESSQGVDITDDEQYIADVILDFYNGRVMKYPDDYRTSSTNRLIKKGLVPEYRKEVTSNPTRSAWRGSQAFLKDLDSHAEELEEIENSELSSDSKTMLANSLVNVRIALNSAHSDPSSVGGTSRTDDEEFIKESMLHSYLGMAKTLKKDYMVESFGKLFSSEVALYKGSESNDGAGISWGEHRAILNEVQDHVEILNEIENNEDLSKKEKKLLAQDLTELRIKFNKANSDPSGFRGAKRTEDEEYIKKKLLEFFKKTIIDIPVGTKRESMMEVVYNIMDKCTDPESKDGSSFAWREFDQFQDVLNTHKKNLMKSSNE